MRVQEISLQDPLFVKFANFAREEWPEDFDIDVKNFGKNLICLVVWENNDVIGGGFVSDLIVNETSYSHHARVVDNLKEYKNLSYVIISPQYRGKNIGTTFLKKLFKNSLSFGYQRFLKQFLFMRN